jgi:dTMP kinase
MIHAYLQSKQPLDDHVIHLLFSANRWEEMDWIRQQLLSGTDIICDRYAYSGIAYSAAKGLDLNWCRKSDEGLIAPDVVVFLGFETPEQHQAVVLQRDGFGEERYEKLEFQLKVAQVYEQLRQDERIPWLFVDASPSKEAVHAQILTHLKPHLNASPQPLSTL